MANLPNLPLIQERFGNMIKDKGEHKNIRCPEFELRTFPQTWGSTALGFGGIGGSAMTTAYTTVAVDNYTGWCGVYFGEVLAYTILNPNQLFWDDIRDERMAALNEIGKYNR